MDNRRFDVRKHIRGRQQQKMNEFQDAKEMKGLRKALTEGTGEESCVPNYTCCLQVLALDINRENYEIGLHVIEKAGVAHKIHLREALSLLMLDQIIANAQITVKDLLDADMNNDGFARLRLGRAMVCVCMQNIYGLGVLGL
ncbi:caffeoyl-CoA O-methyltransferase-like protein [Tanacetum coccineum]